ncbi:DUF452 family protein [Prolixibacteraceae bacterium JC049]|nr:DUF452 family protein [Prolixibacteraceae bacterium JC049]
MSIIERKNNNQHLLLVFNGWGMDEHAFPNHPNMDMLIISEWHTHPVLPMDKIRQYEKVTLVAWSLGVWQAMNCNQLTPLKLEKAIAINGTGQPIHNEYGIPVSIFERTLQQLNQAGRDKFQMRMMGGVRAYKSLIEQLPLRTLENQRDELQYFWDEAQTSSSELMWTKAIIGQNDLIFPTQNQLNYWEGKAEIQTLDIPHYPFIDKIDWETILD